MPTIRFNLWYRGKCYKGMDYDKALKDEQLVTYLRNITPRTAAMAHLVEYVKDMEFLVSEEEEEEEEEGEESDDGADDASSSAEEEDATDADYGYDRREALQRIRAHPHLDTYKDESGVCFVYRTVDSQPNHITGEYKTLIKTIEEVLGRKAVKEEKDVTRHFFRGIDPSKIYSSMHTSFDDSFFGCLCNQNQRKRGGIKRRYGMKDAKTGLVFLYGQCCAAYQNHSTPAELDKYYFGGEDAVGIGKRACKRARE